MPLDRWLVVARRTSGVPRSSNMEEDVGPHRGIDAEDQGNEAGFGFHDGHAVSRTAGHLAVQMVANPRHGPTNENLARGNPV